jgi:hypothetical protein
MKVCVTAQWKRQCDWDNTVCVCLLKHQWQVHGNKVSQLASKDTTIKDCTYMYAICVSIFSIIIMIVIVVQCHHSFHVSWSSTLLNCNIAQTKKQMIICTISMKKSRQFGLISRVLWWASSLHLLPRTKLTKNHTAVSTPTWPGYNPWLS